MKLNKIIRLGLLTSGVFLAGCTKLDEKFRSDLTSVAAGSVDVNALLQSSYDAMQQPYQDQSEFWAAQEHTTDEAMGPTRGGDWDDNGIWRVLHNHKWDADHSFLANAFQNLGKIVFGTTDILRFSPTPAQAAQARFLRAFAMFSELDGWGVVPYREPSGSYSDNPKVRKGVEALDYIVAELTAILPDLPLTGPAYKANRNAAKVLLMKCYLNRGAFINRAAPTFDNADMQKVSTLADEITATAQYSLANNYYDNFAKNNSVISTENIFTGENIGGSKSGNVRSRWFCGLHYNNNPSGWNGFTTLSDFYDKFEVADSRRRANYPGVTNVSGLNVGFLIGQQFNQNGVALNDRKGNALVFSRDVKIKETGNLLEIKGIRVMKYPPDYTSGDNADNDYVFFRYADVVLMKAEALLRQTTPNPGAALILVNSVRTKRAATLLASIDLTGLLDERGREFYWEALRRQDLIRFGKFLTPWQEKPTDDPKNLYFPIPNRELAVNPNLSQNPGY